MDNDNAKQMLGRLGLYSAKLVAEMRAAKGNVLTDEYLTSVIEMDTRVGGRGYNYLLSAIRFVLKHDHVFWRRVPKANAIQIVKVWSDAEMILHSRRKHVRRESVKSVHILECVKMADLNAEEKREYLTHSAQMRLLAVAADNSTRRKMLARDASSMTDPKKLLNRMIEQLV